jgi:hypothetical protein
MLVIGINDASEQSSTVSKSTRLADDFGALKSLAIEVREGALRTRNRALHLGHSTWRGRRVILFVSVTTLTTPKEPDATCRVISKHPSYSEMVKEKSLIKLAASV